MNKNFINYAVILLLKDKKDHLFSFVIFTLIVFIFSSVIFISNSLQKDLLTSVENLPDIVATTQRAGKQDIFTKKDLRDILLIRGVRKVEGGVDGYYHFSQSRLWFHIIGDTRLKDDEMIVGRGVKKALEERYYDDEFNFLTKDSIINIKNYKDAPVLSGVYSNDAIYLSLDTAARVLGLKRNEFTKVFIYAPNQTEVPEIALKIEAQFPGARAKDKEQTISEIKHLYYYKGGVFMVIYAAAMVAFFIMLKNQISLVFGEKKKEIAILRSVGYSIKNIISLKFIQNIIVSVSAYLLGIVMAYFYVFMFGAPLLRNIFLGSELESAIIFTPNFDFNALFLIFVFSVIPFLAFVIIPSWKVAISDMSEALKS